LFAASGATGRLYGTRIEAGVGAGVESRVESDADGVPPALVDPPIVKAQSRRESTLAAPLPTRPPDAGDA